MRLRAVHIVLLLTLSAALAGCGHRGRVIPGKKFMKLYTEMYLADQWLRDNPDIRRTADTTLFFDPIFRRHGYSFADYDRSVHYYLDRPEKYGKLLSYFRNNKEALISYKRRGIELPSAPEGKEYRQCGTAESNIYSVLARRMKGCRACWSIRGGEHLAKLLTLYATGRLQDNYAVLTRTTFDEQIQKPIQPHCTSASKVPHSEGKGYAGCPTAQIPNLSWAKKVFGMKPLSEL